MSIEQALKENTDALLAHTAMLGKMLGMTEASGKTASSAETDETSQESTEEAPKRERGKPSPGKQRRTAEEVAEDKAADEADAAAAGEGGSAESGGTVTLDTLKPKLAKWLGEFSKESDADNPDGAHPEVLARKAALKAVLNKLTGTDDGKLGAIASDSDKIAKLDDWYENKAKVADKGHGKGRLAPDPEPADGGDDDLDI